jgi:dTDP-4-dehydrorhamnose reductase
LAGILITGATGLLGASLTACLKEKGFEFRTHGFSQEADCSADLSDRRAAFEMLDNAKPDRIINLVALADVDGCELDPDSAYRTNTKVAENLAEWTAGRAVPRLAHISTDQVYDSPGLNAEDNVVIRNMYAMTKYASELAAMKAPGSLVLRVNFFGRSLAPGRSSFSDMLIDTFTNRKPITLFTDIMFSPLSLGTLCEMIAVAAMSEAAGVYNLGSRDGMSKRDFAVSLAARLGLSLSSAREGISDDFNFKARRPKNMLMDCSRFERDFNVKLPTLKEEIANAEV